LLQAARAHALLEGRGYCLPEDVQAVFVAIAAHRLIPAAASGATRDELARRLLTQVPVR
jgi:MoxR-like ATPase